MARTQYFVAATIDGFIADSKDGIEWLSAFDDVTETHGLYEAFIAEVGAIVMGSKTYEFLLRHDPVVWAYPKHPAWVFTKRSLPTYQNATIHFTQNSIESVHEAMTLAANGKNLWVVGGGVLASQFAEKNLLDDLLLTTVPVVLGEGVPLFGRPLRKNLELRSMQTFRRGMFYSHYSGFKNP